MKKITATIKVVVLALILATGISYIQAATWTGPSATPPGSNVSAPLNVDSSTQSKLGSLWLNTSIPTANPFGLQVWGKSIFNGVFALNDGTAAAGKVLTASDASGTAAWATPSNVAATIVCTKNTAINGSVSQSAHTTTYASGNCGGTLPDTHYTGTLSYVDVCDGAISFAITSSPAAVTWHGAGGSAVFQDTAHGGTCPVAAGDGTLVSTIRVVYIKTN